MNRYLGGIGVVFCLATFAWGLEQEAPPQPKPALPTRVRVLDMRRAILLCNEGKKATDVLNKRIASRSAELERKQTELQGLQKQYSAVGVNDEKRAELASLIERRGKEFNRLKDDYTAELQQAESEMINGVGKTIIKVLDGHAKKQGYDLVLHTAQDGSVLWWPPAMDITDELVAAVNLATGQPKAASAGSAEPTSTGGAPR